MPSTVTDLAKDLMPSREKSQKVSKKRGNKMTIEEKDDDVYINDDNEFDFVQSNEGEIPDDLSGEDDNVEQVANVSDDEIDIDDI